MTDIKKAAESADKPEPDNKVTTVVSCHTFNQDCSMLALSPNNEEIHIYKINNTDDPKKWERKYVLKEHGGVVSGLDWCGSTNNLASCGHDRNAYVWVYEAKADSWKPTLVILRIDRAATCIKWSPSGLKFAVGSGQKCVPVCQYDKGQDWWISKMIKKPIKSTVTSLAWCPNSKFIAVGSCDGKCRVFSAYIDKIDPAEDDGFGEVWPKQHEFGLCLMELDAGSWINSVAWNPSAFRIAFATHSSTVSFVQILGGSDPLVQRVLLKNLPFLDIRFLSDNTLVGVGFDNNPTLFTVQSGGDSDPKWGFYDVMDGKEEKKATAAAPAAGTGTAGARQMFKDRTDKGIGGAGKKETSAPGTQIINTRHTNTINCMWTMPISDSKTVLKYFWTSGLDGRVLKWDVSKITELK